MSLVPLGLALWLVQSAAPAPADAVRPKAPPGLSWQDADQIADTVARLERVLPSEAALVNDPARAAEARAGTERP